MATTRADYTPLTQEVTHVLVGVAGRPMAVSGPRPFPVTTATVASDLPLAANCLNEAEVLDGVSVVFSVQRLTLRPVVGGYAVTADGDELRQEWYWDGGYREEERYSPGELEVSPTTLDLGVIHPADFGESWYDRLADAAGEQIRRGSMVGRAEGFEVLLEV